RSVRGAWRVCQLADYGGLRAGVPSPPAWQTDHGSIPCDHLGSSLETVRIAARHLKEPVDDRRVSGWSSARNARSVLSRAVIEQEITGELRHQSSFRKTEAFPSPHPSVVAGISPGVSPPADLAYGAAARLVNISQSTR